MSEERPVRTSPRRCPHCGAGQGLGNELCTDCGGAFPATERPLAAVAEPASARTEDGRRWTAVLLFFLIVVGYAYRLWQRIGVIEWPSVADAGPTALLGVLVIALLLLMATRIMGVVLATGVGLLVLGHLVGDLVDRGASGFDVSDRDLQLSVATGVATLALLTVSGSLRRRWLRQPDAPGAMVGVRMVLLTAALWSAPYGYLVITEHEARWTVAAVAGLMFLLAALLPGPPVWFVLTAAVVMIVAPAPALWFDDSPDPSWAEVAALVAAGVAGAVARLGYRSRRA